MRGFRDTTIRRRETKPRPLRNRSRSTTSSTFETTDAASSATNVWKPVVRTPRILLPFRWSAAASMRASRPSSTAASTSRPASTVATASVSAPPGRSCSRASTTCATPAPGTRANKASRERFAPTVAWVVTSSSTSRTNQIVKVTSPLDHSVTQRTPLHQRPFRLAVCSEPEGLNPLTGSSPVPPETDQESTGLPPHPASD